MTTHGPIESEVRALRDAYERVCRALPWLDAAVWPDDPPAFPAYAPPVSGDAVVSAPLDESARGRLAAWQAERGIRIARYAPGAGTLAEAAAGHAAELERLRLPVSVLHTDATWEELDAAAAWHPAVQWIIESGPIKLLYHIRSVETLMQRRPNVWLCLYNFCNWLGIERLVNQGLGDRLLYGSHQPRFNPHAAMGPIVMSRLEWSVKCGLAGNNLRRLLGLPLRQPAPVPFAPPAPFVVDAHSHNGPNERFPVADETMRPADWLAFMDAACLERLLMCPIEALLNFKEPPRPPLEKLIAAAPDRFRYFEAFHPQGGADHLARIEASLKDPFCIGIKIHPSSHKVEADAPSYAPVYALAEARNATIMTHSWDVSPTNPVQYMSHPDRFRPHLARHPRTRLVLGHAGGRPGSLESLVALCREFPGVSVDLAGDYYDAGLIECLADRVGADRVLFASDINWIDARANMAPVLASRLPDADVGRMLRGNALRIYPAGGRAPGR